MKELLREYQSVLITCIASMFVFICIYTVLPNVVSEAENNKAKNTTLDYIKEDSSEYKVQLNYPEGDKIRLIKGMNFNIGEYITIIDKTQGEISNYEYTLNINGAEVEKFDTEFCGGYHICAEIIYKGNNFQGELLVIVEER